MNNQIINLFPIPVCCYELNREITLDEKNIVISYSKNIEKNIGNNITSNFDVLKNKEFQDLKFFFEEKINDYKEKIICPKNNLSLYITESWLNYTNKNESHHAHNHPNSIVSGVFYFNVTENDSITFYKKEEKFLEIEYKEFNNYNNSTFTLPIKKRQLILFPSNIIHGVNKNNYDKTRISLAFNTFFKGTLNTKVTTCLTL